MSLVITLYTREGLVMASDSRLTLNAEEYTPNGPRVLLAAALSDSNYKTFLTKNNIGVSTFGAADINGVPISGFIQDHISTTNTKDANVTEFANGINEYFRTFNPIPDVGFHICGYEKKEKLKIAKVYRVLPFHNKVDLVNPENGQGEIQGATWNGETDPLTRIIQPVFVQNEKGDYQPLPQYSIPWQFFTLQDAIDFAVFAIQVTIDCVRFSPRPKTVGGPVDVLVIQRDQSLWISRKELKINQH